MCPFNVPFPFHPGVRRRWFAADLNPGKILFRAAGLHCDEFWGTVEQNFATVAIIVVGREHEKGARLKNLLKSL